MITKAQKIRLGVFLLMGFSLILLFIFLVIGDSIGENRDTYFLEFQDTSVNGLQVGSDIKYHGIKIGRIENIRIDDEDVSKVIVEMSVVGGTNIKEDAEAILVMVGITGLKYVEIRGGSNEAEKLPPGSFVKTGSTTLDNITGKAEVIAGKIEILLNNINSVLSAENKEHFSSILKNSDEMILENKEKFSNISTHLDSLTYYLASITKESNEIITDLNRSIDEDNLRKIVNNTAEFSGNLKKVDIVELSQNLNDTIVRTNKLMKRMDLLVATNTNDVSLIIETLQATLDNLLEFSQIINDDPRSLYRGVKQE